jgi:hypothetical protein
MPAAKNHVQLPNGKNTLGPEENNIECIKENTKISAKLIGTES